MSSKLKILTVFGTRPEAIKMAPLVRLLQEDPDIESRLCVTAQHREMLDQVLKFFELKPDYDLNVMKPGQALPELTCRILTGVTEVLEDFKPDHVLVHGDTTTTLATSLAAMYAKISIGHVEAGLRSGNTMAPWPEEYNRRVTTLFTNLQFAPTTLAASNLMAEGVPESKIFVTGNTVVDALLWVKDKIDQDESLSKKLDAQFNFLNPDKRLVLVTGHRRENFGDGMERVCKGLKELAEDDSLELLFPVHLNPNVQEPVQRLLGGKDNLHLIKPVDYLPFVYLMSRASLIITDSGGIQEEAPSFGVPVLVTRDTTERPEGIDAGVVKLVGTNTEQLLLEARKSLENTKNGKSQNTRNPYGDGHACQHIVDALKAKH